MDSCTWRTVLNFCAAVVHKAPSAGLHLPCSAVRAATSGSKRPAAFGNPASPAAASRLLLPAAVSPRSAHSMLGQDVERRSGAGRKQSRAANIVICILNREGSGKARMFTTCILGGCTSAELTVKCQQHLQAKKKK